MEACLGVFPFVLRLIVIFCMARTRSSCSSLGSFCKEAYIISAIFRAAFFCLASLLSVFIFRTDAAPVRPLQAAFPFTHQLS